MVLLGGHQWPSCVVHNEPRWVLFVASDWPPLDRTSHFLDAITRTTRGANRGFGEAQRSEPSSEMPFVDTWSPLGRAVRRPQRLHRTRSVDQSARQALYVSRVVGPARIV